jgi:hypothetical protein
VARWREVTMRRVVLALAAAVVLSVGVPEFVTAGPEPGSPVVASATGSGHILLLGEIRVFTFTAQKGADGTVKGQVEIRFRPFDAIVHAELDCLRVIGTTAVISGPVTRSTIPGIEGLRGITSMQDNGEGAAAPPDTTAWPTPLVPQSSPLDCNTIAPASSQVVAFGNVQVRG